jgi:glycosyltransferase involved in cell wall biosynthesis
MTPGSNRIYSTLNRDSAIAVSVVCAVFNEGQCVDTLLDNFQRVISKLDVSFELIVVDDGSQDDTLDRLKRRSSGFPALRVVELSRNFGQVGALSAGLTLARGQKVVVMDGDLQHDPEDIPRLLEHSFRGYDMVATYRANRAEGMKRKLITWFGNRINRFLTGMNILDFGSTFRVVDCHVLEELKDWQGRVHYNTPMLYAGSKRLIQLPITQHKRQYGRSKWTLNMFLIYNLDFVTASSKLTQFFLVISLIGCLAGAFLYTIKILNIFENVQAASAPAYILLSSLQLGLLSIVWREIIEAQKFAKGTPPFLIKAVWWEGAQLQDAKLVSTGLGTGRV